MTVASLWKALDNAGCGEAVGEEDMIDPQRKTARVNPWTFNERQRRYQKIEDRPSLAVDLSIWICESLTSRAMNDHNENPTLHLVFTRTMKLLSMGIKLIYVIEGKRRIRSSKANAVGEKEQDKFRRRRSGTTFWKACQQCETMLEKLGVPVVRAKAEGEALCALLNHQGIVDGVISNDGDCLLFGATVVYTKFSIDNLDKGCVMRYDASRLRAVTEGTNDDNEQINGSKDQPNNASTSLVPLSRKDLVVFALLTGSDLAGDGLAKVGYKKAVRFIRKCQLDHPLSPETAAIEELESWARSVKPIVVTSAQNDNSDDDATFYEPETHGDENNKCSGKEGTKKKQTCCTRCSHAGSKRSHEKHGCEICGTAPGELCYKLSADDKFRKSLRAKALALRDPKFDPKLVVDAYMRPNDNQIPASLLLAGMTSSKTLRMGYPKLRAIVGWSVVVKGHSLSASQDYLKQSVARLLARTGLFQSPPGDGEDANRGPGPTVTEAGANQRQRRLCPRERPIPKEITRKLVQNSVDCYEVCWIMSATLTDTNGEDIDGYEFLTVEPQDMVTRQHPQLVEAFKTAPRKQSKKQQGETEMQKRRDFLESLFQPTEQKETKQPMRPEKSKDQRNFVLPAALKKGGASRARKKQLKKHRKTPGDDVAQLLRFATAPDNAPTNSKKSDKVDDFDFSSIESGSLATEKWLEEDEEAEDKPLAALKEVGPSWMTEEEGQRADKVKMSNQGPLSSQNEDGHNRRRHHQLPPEQREDLPSRHAPVNQRARKSQKGMQKQPLMEMPPDEKDGHHRTGGHHNQLPSGMGAEIRLRAGKPKKSALKKAMKHARPLLQSLPAQDETEHRHQDTDCYFDLENQKAHTAPLRNREKRRRLHVEQCASENQEERSAPAHNREQHCYVPPTNDRRNRKLKVPAVPPHAAAKRDQTISRRSKQHTISSSKHKAETQHLWVVACGGGGDDEVSALTKPFIHQQSPQNGPALKVDEYHQAGCKAIKEPKRKRRRNRRHPIRQQDEDDSPYDGIERNRVECHEKTYMHSNYNDLPIEDSIGRAQYSLIQEPVDGFIMENGFTEHSECSSDAHLEAPLDETMEPRCEPSPEDLLEENMEKLMDDRDTLRFYDERTQQSRCRNPERPQPRLYSNSDCEHYDNREDRYDPPPGLGGEMPGRHSPVEAASIEIFDGMKDDFTEYDDFSSDARIELHNGAGANSSVYLGCLEEEGDRPTLFLAPASDLDFMATRELEDTCDQRHAFTATYNNDEMGFPERPWREHDQRTRVSDLPDSFEPKSHSRGVREGVMGSTLEDFDEVGGIHEDVFHATNEHQTRYRQVSVPVRRRSKHVGRKRVSKFPNLEGGRDHTRNAITAHGKNSMKEEGTRTTEKPYRNGRKQLTVAYEATKPLDDYHHHHPVAYDETHHAMKFGDEEPDCEQTNPLTDRWTECDPCIGDEMIMQGSTRHMKQRGKTAVPHRGTRSGYRRLSELQNTTTGVPKSHGNKRQKRYLRDYREECLDGPHYEDYVGSVGLEDRTMLEISHGSERRHDYSRHRVEESDNHYSDQYETGLGGDDYNACGEYGINHNSRRDDGMRTGGAGQCEQVRVEREVRFKGTRDMMFDGDRPPLYHRRLEPDLEQEADHLDSPFSDDPRFSNEEMHRDCSDNLQQMLMEKQNEVLRLEALLKEQKGAGLARRSARFEPVEAIPTTGTDFPRYSPIAMRTNRLS